MTLSKIAELINCKIISGNKLLNIDIKYGCASDLMSDVLTFSQSGAVLLTGLVNLQTIHTAYISDIKAIIFVRGKRPTEDIIQLAIEKNIPLLSTNYSMYEACGLLYKAGLESTMKCIHTADTKSS